MMGETNNLKISVEFVQKTDDVKKELVKWLKKNIKKKMYLFDVYKTDKDLTNHVWQEIHDRIYEVVDELGLEEKSEENSVISSIVLLKEVVTSLMEDVPEYFELFTDKKILKNVMITIIKKLWKQDNWAFFKVTLHDESHPDADVEYGYVKFDKNAKLTMEDLENFMKRVNEATVSE